MSVILAENFEDFSLVEGDRVLVTNTSGNAIKAVIPSERFTLEGTASSQNTIALNLQYRSGVDSNNPDDRWPSICRQESVSGYSYTQRFVYMYPTGISTNSHPKYCFSMRIKPGFQTSVGEEVLRISVGLYKNVIATINQKGVMTVNVAKQGQTATKYEVPTSLFSFYAQKEYRLELVCTKTGTGCTVEIYSNNIKLSTTYSNAASNSTVVMVGCASATAILPNDAVNQPIFHFRDMAVVSMDDSGWSKRLGSSFYVDKHAPTSDVNVEWDGDKPHYAFMGSNMPVTDSKEASTTNENSSEIFGFSGGKTKGSMVAAVGVDLKLENKGSAPVPVSLVFNNAEATMLKLAPQKPINGIVELPLNPTTASDWKPKELDSFTSGMVVKET